MAITNAQLAQQLSEFIDRATARDDTFEDWMFGPAGGGPDSDGRYALTDYLGNTLYVKSPLQLEADVEGLVNSASSYASTATTKADEASQSASAALSEADRANTLRDETQELKDITLAAEQQVINIRNILANWRTEISGNKDTVLQALADTEEARDTTLGYRDTTYDYLLSAQEAEQNAQTWNPANYIPVSEIGVADGITPLDSNAKIPVSFLPSIAITDTFVVNSQAEMLALDVQRGDVAVRNDLEKSYILAGDDPTVLSNWQVLKSPTDQVQSVDGRTGVVTLGDLYSPVGHGHDWSDISNGPIFKRSTIQTLSPGWYTIARIGDGRASAKFTLVETDGGSHQTVHFYAAIHYSNSPSITVLNNSSYSGGGAFRYIRIMRGGTYDPAYVQVFVDSSGISGCEFTIQDDIQSPGWELIDFSPQDSINGASEAVRVDLDDTNGIITTGNIIEKGERVWSNNHNPGVYTENNKPHWNDVLSKPDELLYSENFGGDLNSLDRTQTFSAYRASNWISTPDTTVMNGINISRGSQTGQYQTQFMIGARYSVKGKVYSRALDDSSNWSPWARHYTTEDKPTYGELGTIQIGDVNFANQYLQTTDSPTFAGLTITVGEGLSILGRTFWGTYGDARVFRADDSSSTDGGFLFEGVNSDGSPDPWLEISRNYGFKWLGRKIPTITTSGSNPSGGDDGDIWVKI